MGCWRTASPPRRPPSGVEATAVIAAAGSGQRLGSGGPKAFVELAGRSLLEWCVAAFAAVPAVRAIVVAAPAGEEERATAIAEAAAGDTATQVVAGAEHRSESVAAALERVETDLVAVHDAARPLVSPELIGAVLAEFADDTVEGVVAATPVTDTVKQLLRGREVERTLDRSSLWAAQTPQAFRVEALRRALASTELLAQATDDAMLLERIGGKVLLHDAPPENIKVTTPMDLRIAELLVAERG
ncbi:MAG: 2-C-methyl-D-erythritol 4-phosphate cytidylyltransferase [Solirubrobacterales bacterium]|nr:2-C-methyl-D-erythritol 4-phosphate cytidylyltransferase [Solirubrobacterales bacterium]